MSRIIAFPRPFRRRAGEDGAPPCPRWRDTTRRRLRSMIARALEILDSLEQDPPPAPATKREEV